jgi:hypothetical protein
MVLKSPLMLSPEDIWSEEHTLAQTHVDHKQGVALCSFTVDFAHSMCS